MSNFTTDEAHRLLNHVYRNTAYTSPTSVDVALFTVAPSDAGGGTEVTGGSYARQTVTFKAPSGRAVLNNEVTFPTATASWGTVNSFAIFDGTDMLAWAMLDDAKAIDEDDEAKFNADEISIAYAASV